MIYNSNNKGKDMEFKDRLNDHLESLKNKDLKTFMETVSTEDITLIMPNGNLITNYKEFYELHKEWFLDEDWTIEYEILKQDEYSNIGTVLLSIVYKDVDENSNPIVMTYYLHLIFKKSGNEWLLIHDQNTIYQLKK